MRAELRPLAKRPTTARGTFAEDAKVYLAQVKHLASYKSRVCEVDAWTALYGRLRRSQLTAEHVRRRGQRGRQTSGDVQGWLGHKQVTTTRKHYTPILVSRLKQTSESLDGRFGGWQGDGDGEEDILESTPAVEGVH